jgi:hypothetical protein
VAAGLFRDQRQWDLKIAYRACAAEFDLDSMPITDSSR